MTKKWYQAVIIYEESPLENQLICFIKIVFQPAFIRQCLQHKQPPAVFTFWYKFSKIPNSNPLQMCQKSTKKENTENFHAKKRGRPHS